MTPDDIKLMVIVVLVALLCLFMVLWIWRGK